MHYLEKLHVRLCNVICYAMMSTICPQYVRDIKLNSAGILMFWCENLILEPYDK